MVKKNRQLLRGSMKRIKGFFLSLFLIASAAAAFFIFEHLGRNTADETEKLKKHHYFIMATAHAILGFDLVDPEQAPLKIKERVMLGHRILTQSQQYAAKYVGGQVACANCHFCGGDTLGGKNSGISLVGVTTEFPQYSQREKREINLADRINACFRRSMNGRPLPKDSPEMVAILSYLEWISHDVEHFKNIPWLGLKTLTSKHVPDANNGETVYARHCVICHRADGEGIAGINPPLWGENSFNDGAGMNTLPRLSAFVYWNMPNEDPILTEEEALDVAAFVIKQPRPHFKD